MCWDAIDFERNTITVQHTIVICDGKPTAFDTTKNDSSHRTIPMSDLIRNALLQEKERQLAFKALQPNDYHDTDYVCVYPDGRPIAPRYLTRHFKKLLKENDLREIRFHDLRHSTASYLLNLGFNMKEISDWLGHSSIQTTMNFYD